MKSTHTPLGSCKTRLILLTASLIASLSFSASADVRLPKIFTDDMMLQRDC